MNYKVDIILLFDKQAKSLSKNKIDLHLCNIHPNHLFYLHPILLSIYKNPYQITNLRTYDI